MRKVGIIPFPFHNYPHTPGVVARLYSNDFHGMSPNLLSVSSLPSPNLTPANLTIRGSNLSVSLSMAWVWPETS